MRYYSDMNDHPSSPDHIHSETELDGDFTLSLSVNQWKIHRVLQVLDKLLLPASKCAKISPPLSNILRSQNKAPKR